MFHVLKVVCKDMGLAAWVESDDGKHHESAHAIRAYLAHDLYLRPSMVKHLCKQALDLMCNGRGEMEMVVATFLSVPVAELDFAHVVPVIVALDAFRLFHSAPLAVHIGQSGACSAITNKGTACKLSAKQTNNDGRLVCHVHMRFGANQYC